MVVNIPKKTTKKTVITIFVALVLLIQTVLSTYAIEQNDNESIFSDSQGVIENQISNNQSEANRSVTSLGYTLKGRLKNITGGPNYVTQGFAVGTDYCYSIDINSSTNEISHKLYRKNMNNSNAVELMTMSGTVDCLGHSNDMTLATYSDNGTVHRYLYVVVNGSNITNSYIIKLEYSGTSYWQVARYNLSGVYTSISRIKYYTSSSGEYMIQLLLRKGNEFHTASVRRTQTGTHSLSTTHRFNVNALSIYPNYAWQGIHYDSNKVYIPLFANSTSNYNRNVILVYNVSDSVLSSSTVNNLINPTEYSVVNSSLKTFEIESVGFPVNNSSLNNDLLWFNTNERNSSNVLQNGGIYCTTTELR